MRIIEFAFGSCRKVIYTLYLEHLNFIYESCHPYNSS